VERAGKRQTLRMVAQAKPAGNAAVEGESPQRLRYAGALGKAQIEVRGVPVNVSEDSRNGEVLIRSHDLLVRVTVPHQ